MKKQERREWAEGWREGEWGREGERKQKLGISVAKHLSTLQYTADSSCFKKLAGYSQIHHYGCRIKRLIVKGMLKGYQSKVLQVHTQHTICIGDAVLTLTSSALFMKGILMNPLLAGVCL